MFSIFKAKDKNRKIELREKSFSQMIPYTYHYDENTILTKSNELISIIKLEGFSFQTADDEDIDNKKILRNNLFKGMAADGLSLYTHIVRRKYSAFPDGEFSDTFPNLLNKQWKDKHGPDRTFINEYYLTIVKRGPKKTTTMLKDIINKFVLLTADK